MELGPCLQRPRQSTQSTRTSPFMPLARSPLLNAARTSFEPRVLQSPPLQTSTWASYSLTFAAGLTRDRVASAPFLAVPFFLDFLPFFGMASSDCFRGLRRAGALRSRRVTEVDGCNISPRVAGRYDGPCGSSRGIVGGAGLSRYSVVDVGSNTIHLLVGGGGGGAVLPVTGEKVSARLGAGVEKTGHLAGERLALAAETITLFAKIAALNGAPSPEILATSAVRDAENGSELVERVRERTGLKMRLISGEKEAALGFRGALSAVRREGQVLVVDLGGGSAQLILGEASQGPERRVSPPPRTHPTTRRVVG